MSDGQLPVQITQEPAIGAPTAAEAAQSDSRKRLPDTLESDIYKRGGEIVFVFLSSQL